LATPRLTDDFGNPTFRGGGEGLMVGEVFTTAVEIGIDDVLGHVCSGV
jgi:hypothetical protein